MTDVMRTLLVEAGLLPSGGDRDGADLGPLLAQNERRLASLHGRRHGHPVVVLGESTLDLGALSVLEEDDARRLRLLPLRVTATELEAAVGDVVAFREADALSFKTGRRLTLYLALGPLLDDAIARAYRSRAGGEKTLRGARSGAAAPFLALERPTAQDAEAGIARLLAGLSGPLAMLRKTAEALPPLGPDEKTEPIPLEGPAETRAPVVVVIEDEDAIRQMVARVLAKDGYAVREARDGREGVAILREGRPDLVVTDAMLPGVHGFEICSRIKHGGWDDVPVILVSAVYRGLDHAREVQEVHGADAFIEKPFAIRLLRELAAQLLGRRLERGELPVRTRELLVGVQEQILAAQASGDDIAARRLLDEALLLSPFDADLHFDQGVLRERAGDLEGALRCFEAAHVYGPDQYAAASRLAALYGRLGFLRRARTTWEAALPLAPNDAARRSIEQVLAHLGATSGARS